MPQFPTSEEENSVLFFVEPPLEFDFPQPERYMDWLNAVAEKEEFQIEELSYIFCTDEYLHKINLEYLAHDTYTDIITFDNSEEESSIEGDIFVSIERVRDNATDFGRMFHEELLRVLSHGLLHLCGYGDKTTEEAALMRQKEDAAIGLFGG